jgi:phospholipase/carboxylesterase
MSDSIVVARPEGQAGQLVLMFHSAGTGPEDMVPLGQALAAEFPGAFVVSVAAPAQPGGGNSWFSLLEIDEASRPGRVAAAMPGFVDTVRRWQREAGVDTDAIALVGFSQGGEMALEATREQPAIAGRVVAIAGRFARLPESPNPGTTLHLLHGKLDPVTPYAATVEAAQHLVRIGADVTADVIPFCGHQINDDVVELLIERLRGHLPRRTWEAALAAARELSPTGEQGTPPAAAED